MLIQTVSWIIPTIQSIHIVAIGVVLASVFRIVLRVLGRTAPDQTLLTTTGRYAPWMWGALIVLVATGILMVIGEPARQLLSLSFWLKMLLLAVGIGVAAAFQRHLRRNERRWEESLAHASSTKTFAVSTFLVWCAIIVLGRFIAWDAQIWGSWSPQTVANAEQTTPR